MNKFKTIAIFAAATILSAYLATGCACEGDDCTTGIGPTVYVAPIVNPFVTFVTPVNGQTGVPVNRTIIAIFSENMDDASIDEATFLVTGPGTTPITGTVFYSDVDRTAVFTPDFDLTPNVAYIATITMGAESQSGIPMYAPFVWTFTAGATPDTTRPFVISTIPFNGETDVSINTAITATFSEVMQTEGYLVSPWTLWDGPTQIPGTGSYAGITGTFTPDSPLSPNTYYTVIISAAAKDLAGNNMAAGYSWNFTTGSAPDTTRPTVTLTRPLSNATGVAINASVNALFSEEMLPASILAANSFTLRAGLVPIIGTVSLNVGSRIATFTPTSPLAPATTYTATITTAATDMHGNTMLNNYVWSFTTAAALVVQPTPVALGAAANFAGLSGSGISNLAASMITGDIGVSPGAGSLITGMTCPQINGTVYIVDAGLVMPPCTTTAAASLAAAKLASEVAYNDAAGRTLPAPATVSGDQGGLTLPPGIYKSTSTLSIASGSLTLDGQGDANAVWIFQIASSLTTVGCGASVPCATGGNVFLINGAKAANVFWQVGSAATIGQYTAFEGTILAHDDISLNTGAQVTGRLLAGAGPGVSPLGAITLLQNVIIMPLP